jgi:hypothetical protein
MHGAGGLNPIWVYLPDYTQHLIFYVHFWTFHRQYVYIRHTYVCNVCVTYVCGQFLQVIDSRWRSRNFVSFVYECWTNHESSCDPEQPRGCAAVIINLNLIWSQKNPLVWFRFSELLNQIHQEPRRFSTQSCFAQPQLAQHLLSIWLCLA